MLFDQIIEARQSIRKYRAEKPPWHLIEGMLKCASTAPSPSNSQPVRYFCLKSDEIRDHLKQEMGFGRDRFLKKLEQVGGSKKIKNRINAYYRFSEFMFSAPYLFAVGVEPVESLSQKLLEARVITEDKKKYTDPDISTGLSLNAFILKGVESGIGTCILTAPLVYVNETDTIINKGVRINSFVTVGFSDEDSNSPLKKTVSDIYMDI